MIPMMKVGGVLLSPDLLPADLRRAWDLSQAALANATTAVARKAAGDEVARITARVTLERAADIAIRRARRTNDPNLIGYFPR